MSSTVEGNDFIDLIDATLTFMPGDDIGTMVCENVTIVNDMDTVEPDQTFTVSLNSSDPVVIAPTAEATVTIVDDDSEKKICLTHQ